MTKHTLYQKERKERERERGRKRENECFYAGFLCEIWTVELLTAKHGLFQPPGLLDLQTLVRLVLLDWKRLGIAKDKKKTMCFPGVSHRIAQNLIH